MNFLKQIPITYVGQLHDVKLINFSVDMEEVLPHVPAGIKVRDFDGKAIISMVNVKLKQMRPVGLPKNLSFEYQHVAFRLLVDDSELNNGDCKGIFFLKSFTNKPMVAWGGNLMTNYQLSPAKIQDDAEFVLQQEDRFISYRLTNEEVEVMPDLKPIIGAIDRAYAMEGERLMKTQIQREEWPIEWVDCQGFDTNFFQSAKLLGAFQVKNIIDYQWLPAKMV